MRRGNNAGQTGGQNPADGSARLRRGDLLLAGAAVAAALLLLAGRAVSRNDGTTAVVRIDGRETARYSLAEDGEFVISGLGGTNLLVIREGEASVTEADCPDRLCVRQRGIRHKGEMIVCLPHRVVIRIEGGEEPEVDGISR